MTKILDRLLIVDALSSNGQIEIAMTTITLGLTPPEGNPDVSVFRIKEKTRESVMEMANVIKEKFDCKNCCWGTWGNYSKNEIVNLFREFGVGMPFSSSHINLKLLYGIMTCCESEVPLELALELCGLSWVSNESGKTAERVENCYEVMFDTLYTPLD